MVQAVINDQLAKMATLVEQKVKEGVNAKVAELQEAAEPKMPNRLKVPSQVSVSIFISTIATHALLGTILKRISSVYDAYVFASIFYFYRPPAGRPLLSWWISHSPRATG